MVAQAPGFKPSLEVKTEVEKETKYYITWIDLSHFDGKLDLYLNSHYNPGFVIYSISISYFYDLSLRDEFSSLFCKSPETSPN